MGSERAEANLDASTGMRTVKGGERGRLSIDLAVEESIVLITWTTTSIAHTDDSIYERLTHSNIGHPA